MPWVRIKFNGVNGKKLLKISKGKNYHLSKRHNKSMLMKFRVTKIP